MHSEKMKGARGPKRARAKKNGWFGAVNPYLVAFGVVGASFCFAWFFSILLTPDFSFGTADPAVLGLLHLTFAIALVVAYVVVWRFSNVLQTHRGALLGASLACCIASSLPGGGGFNLI